MSPFVIIFARSVERGRDFKTGVPDNLKEDVKALLESQGLGHLTA